MDGIAEAIESNFGDLCVAASELCSSGRGRDRCYDWAGNPYDEWFSRVYHIRLPADRAAKEIALLRGRIQGGVLQASAMGRPVYEALGFKACLRVSHWRLPA